MTTPTTPSQSLNLYYVHAESDEGNNYDLVVAAADPQHAIRLWHDDWNCDDEDEPFWTWETHGIGVGLILNATDLVQDNLTPGSLPWAVTPIEAEPAKVA